MKYAVAVGEMFDSINFFGPFDGFDEAELWADRNANLNWWIVGLESTEVTADQVGGNCERCNSFDDTLSAADMVCEYCHTHPEVTA